MNLSKLQKIVKDSLVCYRPLGRKESDMTEQLNSQQGTTSHMPQLRQVTAK